MTQNITIKQPTLMDSFKEYLEKIKSGNFPDYEREVKEIIEECKDIQERKESSAYESFAAEMKADVYKHALLEYKQLKAKYGNSGEWFFVICDLLSRMSKGENIKVL
jgi:hypothetical protein